MLGIYSQALNSYRQSITTLYPNSAHLGHNGYQCEIDQSRTQANSHLNAIYLISLYQALKKSDCPNYHEFCCRLWGLNQRLKSEVMQLLSHHASEHTLVLMADKVRITPKKSAIQILTAVPPESVQFSMPVRLTNYLHHLTNQLAIISGLINHDFGQPDVSIEAHQVQERAALQMLACLRLDINLVTWRGDVKDLKPRGELNEKTVLNSIRTKNIMRFRSPKVGIKTINRQCQNVFLNAHLHHLRDAIDLVYPENCLLEMKLSHRKIQITSEHLSVIYDLYCHAVHADISTLKQAIASKTIQLPEDMTKEDAELFFGREININMALQLIIEMMREPGTLSKSEKDQLALGYPKTFYTRYEPAKKGRSAKRIHKPYWTQLISHLLTHAEDKKVS